MEKCIIIIDDSPTIRVSVEMALKGEKVTVKPFQSEDLINVVKRFIK